jgi:hypothetical protein
MRNHRLPAMFVLTLAATSASAQTPLGPEFLVNGYTTYIQLGASVGAAADGRFVVVWDSIGQDGQSGGVFGRLFDAAGAPIGATEFRVNVQTLNAQYGPAVAMHPGGGFVVSWVSIPQDGSGAGIFARRFDAAGGAFPEFRVNSYTTGRQADPAIAADAAGNFIVTWTSEGQDGSGRGVYAQRYDAAGVPQGLEFRVNTYTPDSQTFPAVAMSPSGGFVVVWDSYWQDGSVRGVFGQRYDAAGTPVGAEFRVNGFTTSQQTQPRAAMDASANFVVTWQSYQQASGSYDIFARRYDAAGVAQGAEFAVNTPGPATERYAQVAHDPAGNFVVAWGANVGDGNGYGILGRVYTALGAAGVEFAVNTYTTGDQGRPSVAFDGKGRFVTAWHDLVQDGSSSGIVARRFAGDHIFKDGLESSSLAAWSASNTDGGDLAASIFAAMRSSGVGLQAVVDDTAALFVEDRSPDDEKRYRARFYLDPNGFDPGEALAHRRTRTLIAFSEAPTRRCAAVVLRRLGGAYSLMARARLDDNTQADTGFFPITDAPHIVELDLVAATGPDSLDGSLQLWIDAVPVAALGSLDNSLAEVDFARMGALSVKTGANGTLYFDEFESRRQTYIGP